MSNLKTKIATVLHEAGHCCVALALGIDVTRVSVQKSASELGCCDFRYTRKNQNHLIAAALAGPIVEQIAGGLSYLPFDDLVSGDDLHVIDNCLFEMKLFGQKAKDHVYVIRLDTEKMLARKEIREAIADVAKALLEHTELTGEQVRSIVKRHVPLS